MFDILHLWISQSLFISCSHFCRNKGELFSPNKMFRKSAMPLIRVRYSWNRKPALKPKVHLIVHQFNELLQLWEAVLNLNLSVKPCNESEIHFRFVPSDQSAECFERWSNGAQRASEGEGGQQHWLRGKGLKQPLIKYIPPRSAAAFFKADDANVNACHGLSLHSSSILFEDHWRGCLWDGLGRQTRVQRAPLLN